MKTDEEVYSEWKKLVNMTAGELKNFMQSDLGKKAGLTKEQAQRLGIGYGRESAQAILRMKAKPVAKWTSQDWSWARRQVSFIKRMKGNTGPLEDVNGNPTRKTLSLLIWGHNPYL